MRSLVVVLALAALFLAAGVLALYLGEPKDVSDLRYFHGGPVRVSGQLVSYGREGNYLYLILRGRDGFTVKALVPYEEVLALAGPSFQFSNTVVVEGIYDPATRTLNVTAILQGCHSAYYSPVS